MRLDRAVTSPSVAVGMSGGVDSTAAALMLLDEGYSVLGLSMYLFDYRSIVGSCSKRSCCSPDDFSDARRVAERAGFPFYVLDFEESFSENVIDPFVDAYLGGITPNPCVECNRVLKFRDLRKRAKAFGAAKLATGHYARIKKCGEDRLGLFTARDEKKDQSYFLHMLTQEELESTFFPLGDFRKEDVRKYLAKRGFDIAGKEESQDVCFVPTSVSDFVEAAELGKGEGDIVDVEGRVLGRHGGIYRYTVGQRRGLGIGGGEPLYVLSVDSSRNRVVVGPRAELERRGFIVDRVNWIAGKAPGDSFRALAKLRYRHGGVLVDAEVLSEDRVEARFTDEWSTVTAGQSAVFYEESSEPEGGREVIGGGIITGAIAS